MPIKQSNTFSAVKAARLIDGTGGAVLKNAVIVVEGDRIKSVGTAANTKPPKGAKLIDAGKYTVMPGLIDCHIHLSDWNCVSFANNRVAVFEVTPQLQAFYTLFHAQLCFEMGFTTLRDMGKSTTRGNFVAEACAVRDSINVGIVAGPRILVSGRPIISGSHLDLTLPRAAVRAPGMVADGPWELRRLTREHVRIGCDWLKTTASGGGGTSDEEPDVRNMTQEELDAIVDEAHAFHKMVAVHCFTAESHRMCVRAGVDSIEHIVFTDPDTIRMIKDSGIPVVPTLSHRTDHAIEIRRKTGTPRNVIEKMKKIQPYCYDSFKKFHQAGVTIAMGTDIGQDPEMGSNALELELYVNLGMTPIEAIMTATKNAAEALNLDKEIGTIQPGKRADILVVDGDPSRDISVLREKRNIMMVMKDGKAFVNKLAGKECYVRHPEQRSWKIIDDL